MTPSQKVFWSLSILLCLAAAAFFWFGRGRTAEEIGKDAVKARQQLDTKSAEELIQLKNTALADLENGRFEQADPALLTLATAGTREPLGRNWTIERLMALQALDSKRDPTAYEEAVERAQTSMNLESSLEPKSPERRYLVSKLAQARGNSKERIFEQHIAAGTAPGDAVLLCELYQAQCAGTGHDRAESEGTLKGLKELAPDNLYVQLEWLSLVARRKDAEIANALNRVYELVAPILADRGDDLARRLDLQFGAAKTAAHAGNWQSVATTVAAIDQMARALPECDADRRRIDRGLLWHVVSDFSHPYYQKHHVDRRLPSIANPVQFQEIRLSGPAANVVDAYEAQFVALNSDGKLELAVLRSEAFEIFGRGGGDQWVSVAPTHLPHDAYNHFLSVDDGFVLFGPAGLLGLESRAKAGGKARALHTVPIPAADKLNGVVSVLTLDVDGDGLNDLVVACSVPNAVGASLHLLHNEGKMGFRDITARSGLAQAQVGTNSLVAVDWDNDLDFDLLAPGPAAPSRSPTDIGFFKGRGLARFRPQRFVVKDNDVRSATSLAVLDADSNGSWDLLASTPHGTVLLLTSTIEHGRVDIIGVEPVSDFAFDHVLVFDFDNDGCPDFLAWNRDAVRCFHGSPEGHFEPAAVVPFLAAGTISSADFGDFDQDGDSDLVLVKTEPGQSTGRLALLRNEGGNANNWIDVRLEAHAVGAKGSAEARIPPFGRGSTLCLKFNGVSQTQIVQRPVTHFGIGSLDSVDVLRVLWSSGVPVNILNPAKRTTVTLTPAAQHSP